jgi:uncharacterized membrane protein YphA (DoxX/SURF4 family)
MPYQRQTLTAWAIAVGAAACGIALWYIGLMTSPVAAVATASLGAAAIIAGWRWVRYYAGRHWPDVAAAQMRELERRRRS